MVRLKAWRTLLHSVKRQYPKTFIVSGSHSVYNVLQFRCITVFYLGPLSCFPVINGATGHKATSRFLRFRYVEAFLIVYKIPPTFRTVNLPSSHAFTARNRTLKKQTKMHIKQFSSRTIKLLSSNLGNTVNNSYARKPRYQLHNTKVRNTLEILSKTKEKQRFSGIINKRQPTGDHFSRFHRGHLAIRHRWKASGLFSMLSQSDSFWCT